MNTKTTIDNLKNARRFLYEVSELEKKYGLKIISISKNSPEGDVKDYLNLLIENGEYEVGMDNKDVYPGYYVALEKV